MNGFDELERLKRELSFGVVKFSDLPKAEQRRQVVEKIRPPTGTFSLGKLIAKAGIKVRK